MNIRLEDQDSKSKKELIEKRRALKQVITQITEYQKKLYTKRANVLNDNDFYEKDTRQLQAQLSLFKLDGTNYKNMLKYQQNNRYLINQKFHVIKKCNEDLYNRIYTWMIKKVFYLKDDSNIAQFTQQTIKAGLLSYQVKQINKFTIQYNAFLIELGQRQIDKNEESQTLMSIGISQWQFQIKVIKTLFKNFIKIAQYKDIIRKGKKSQEIDLKKITNNKIEDNKMNLKILAKERQLVKQAIENTKQIKKNLIKNLQKLEEIIKYVNEKQTLNKNNNTQLSKPNISSVQANRRRSIFSNNFQTPLITNNKPINTSLNSTSYCSQLSASGPVKPKLLSLVQSKQIVMNPQNKNTTNNYLLNVKNQSQRLKKQQQQIDKIKLFRRNSISCISKSKEQPKKRFLQLW